MMKVEFSLNCSGTFTDYSEWVDVSRLALDKQLDANNDPIKSQSGAIEIYGDAYNFFYTNIISSPNIYSNSICIRITDDVCGEVQNFKIGSQNLKWCEGGECRIQLEMEGVDVVLDCIRSTIIANNASIKFQHYPGPGMIHPRFRYCDIIKPTWFFGIMVTFFNSFDFFIVGLNGIILMLNSGFNIINTIIGSSLPTIGYINFITDKWLGCGRGWPAPYIRTYIDNVCDVCSATITDVTAPILYDEESAYYNACLLTAYAKKGVDMDGNMDYIPNNQPSWTLDQLFSKIKDFWNARWFIYGDDIYFERKDKIGELIWGTGYALDFTTANDKNRLLGNVCFTYNGEPKLRRLNMNYATDASDNIGNENLNRFNGEYMYSGANPNYTGSKVVTMDEFGAVSHVLDGQDSLYDANITQAVGSVLGGLKWGGCLKTQGDTLQYAKILIHDTLTPIEDARTMGIPYLPFATLPEFQDDNALHFPIGYSELANYNAPMSFALGANGIQNNLWDFHAIDIPDDAKKTNIGFELTMEFCCEYSTLDIYQAVKFENGWEGEISSVKFDYAERKINVKGNIK